MPSPPSSRAVFEAPPHIVVLPPDVAARIAAGEVIERPASVVKELLENAIDAGASSIEVLIEGGGAERIRVRDDGCGIAPEQLGDAFERHATSKLRFAEDLFDVRTLGFRGEALSAIAAAGDVDLTTRPQGQDAAAVTRYRGGRHAGLGAAPSAPGTTVEVRRLFEALPARRRFLRGDRAETRAVAEVVSDAALAHPEVAFRLLAEGRTLFASPGSGALRDAVAAVHGAELADALVPLDGERTDPETGAEVRIGGAVGAPSMHRSNRRALHLVVNGRPVTSRTLHFVIEQAYSGLLPSGRHPVGVVRIEVPPEQVDVNVHPTKAEVRLRHERFVHGAVHAAVLDALTGAPVASLPFAWPAPVVPRAPMPGTEARAVLASVRPASPALHDSPPPHADVARGIEAGTQSEVSPQQPLDVRGPALLLRPLGQVDRSYLVAESADGVVMVDQHAAHERVLYEQVLASRGDDAEKQPLLESVLAALTPSQAHVAAEEQDALSRLGWEIEPTDGAAVLVRALPAVLARRAEPATELASLLDLLLAEYGAPAPDRVAAALACRAAVRAGDRMDEPQQRALLEALERAEQPLTCPHGRPTMLHLSREALNRSFGRPERGRSTR
ncbi:MAG: DNA mismatch repair endonuclease MutL [Dehalococcoidia bacterium]